MLLFHTTDMCVKRSKHYFMVSSDTFQNKLTWKSLNLLHKMTLLPLLLWFRDIKDKGG